MDLKNRLFKIVRMDWILTIDVLNLLVNVLKLFVFFKYELWSQGKLLLIVNLSLLHLTLLDWGVAFKTLWWSGRSLSLCLRHQGLNVVSMVLSGPIQGQHNVILNQVLWILLESHLVWSHLVIHRKALVADWAFRFIVKINYDLWGIDRSSLLSELVTETLACSIGSWSRSPVLFS